MYNLAASFPGYSFFLISCEELYLKVQNLGEGGVEAREHGLYVYFKISISSVP